MQRIFVTGSAGFIGFHLSKLLLEKGCSVTGYDGLTDYYDVSLKAKRQSILQTFENFTCFNAMLEDQDALRHAYIATEPTIVIHLAAQAGVRYSLENPRAYIDSNIVGTFNLMELTREYGVEHLLMASTSSVYGANTDMPFYENQHTDTPLTLYAASKKATESMAHSYAHLWNIPTTMFRFFSVYGTWGRPDLALFKFVKATLAGEPIDVYNHGKMSRDFTYVDDLVAAIDKLKDVAPMTTSAASDPSQDYAAPYRIVNIGNSEQIALEDFISEMENALGLDAKRNYMGMQMGDVRETLADTQLLKSLTGYSPSTPVSVGVEKFVAWYRDYYKV